MGRKTKNQKNIKAIIVCYDNKTEIIELDQNENIKNKDDLSKLKKLPKKRNYRKKAKKQTENLSKSNQIIEPVENSTDIFDSLFDESILKDFSFEENMMQDYYHDFEQGHFLFF